MGQCLEAAGKLGLLAASALTGGAAEGLEIAGTEAAEAAAEETGTVAGRSVDEVLSGLRPGRTPPNLEVNSLTELNDVFDELSQGGSPVQSSYPGKFVELEDGTRIGLRATSRSGDPTIDVFKPDGTYIKVHLP
jgi:hypothetical protein